MIRLVRTRVKHFISPKYTYLKRFTIKRGDVVIDCGANVGEVSEYFLSKGALVHAYEPNAHAYGVLLKRIGRNKKLYFYPHAVSNFAGRSKLFLHHNHHECEVNFSQAGSLKSEKDNLGDDFMEVDVVNIKDVLDQHDHIRLMKIDIEGGEYDIMDEVLRQIDKIDYILLETHERKNASFMEKNNALLAQIERTGAGHKIFTDWF
jgi:FkbM family methyltransferase